MAPVIRVLCVIATVAVSSAAHAFINPPVVSPEQPTDATPITLTLRYGECDELLNHEVVQKTGSIDITIVKETRAPPFCNVPESEYEVSLGLLAPGTYWFRTRLQDHEPPGEPPVLFHNELVTVRGSVAYFSDLEVELIATPSVYLPPGTEGRVTARFTNHGPDLADRVSGRTPHAIHFGPTIPYQIYLGPFTTCDVWFQTFFPQPGQPLTATMNFSLHEPLPVGETRECVIGFDSKPFATGSFTLQVEVFYFGALNYTDPDLSNNMDELNFVFGSPPPAAATPVPMLNSLGLALLVTGFLLVSLLRGRHD